MVEPDDTDTDTLFRFLYACPIGLIQTDLDGGFTLSNPLAMKLVMPLTAGLPSMNIFQLFEQSAPELRNLVQAHTAGHGPICSGHRIYVGNVRGQQNGKPYVLACTIVKIEGGRLIISLENVSEQVAQERRLKQAEVWFASLLDSPDGFAVIGLDSAGQIEVLNASARQQTGFSDEDLLGKHATALDSPDAGSTALSIDEEIELAKRDGWHLADGWCALRDGGRYRCQRLISVCREVEADGRQEVTGYTVVLRPATKDRVDAHELRRRLTTDHLTGALNRAHFFEVAEYDRQRCAHKRRPLGLLMMDLDHFKAINDTHGHAVGDGVLEQVVRTCVAVLRPGDSFARLGGEEFVALLPMADAEVVRAVGERMRAAVADTPVRAGDVDLRITVSLGGVSDPSAGLGIKDLIAAADAALYKAKRNGRNRLILDQTLKAVA